jgi:hypothetical protein
MSVLRRSLIALAALAWAWPTGAALAAAMSFNVSLTGAQQIPPVDTKGGGTAHLTYDPAARVATWSIAYSNLTGPVTMAHFHDGAQGQNGPVTIWLSTKGSPVSSPITGKATLTPQQAQQFTAGQWYINLHTNAHPAGEIRGQVTPPKG